MKYALGLALAVVLSACGSDGESGYGDKPTPAPTPPPTVVTNSKEFTTQVQPVFEKICAKCHTPTSNLPFAFITSEVAAKGKALAQIKAGTMPKGAQNQKDFAPSKDLIISILSK